MDFQNLRDPLSPPFLPRLLASLSSNIFLQRCYRYRWLILSSTLLALVGISVWALLQTPIFQSSTQLTLETQSNIDEINAKTNPLFQTLSEIQLETHIKHLKSAPHLKKSAEKLSRDNSPGYQAFVSRIQRTTAPNMSLKESLRAQIQSLADKLSPWLPYSLSQLLKRNLQDSSMILSQHSLDEQITNWLTSHILITRALLTSSITITAQADSPVFASEIANTVAAVYVAKFSQPSAQTAPTYSSWKKSERIKSELETTRNSLEEAKATLRAFQIEHPHGKLEEIAKEPNAPPTEMSPIDAELTLLAKEVNQQELRYTTLLKKIEPEPVVPTKIFDRITITRPAFPVNSPIGPHPMLTALWGLPIGLGGGMGMAIFLEWITRRKGYIQKPADLKKITPELPFLGWLLDSDSTENGELSQSDLHSANVVDEYLQNIRKWTENLPTQEATRTWLITSPGNHEGKTLLAQNMVKVFTQQASLPVLLIDANFSHPTLHTIVPLRTHNQQTNGLSDFLFNGAEISTIIQDTKISNLRVISIGQWAALPPEEFPSDRFQQLLQWCKTAQYHVMIIGPPVLQTEESGLLASHVDDTMVVVRPGTTSRKDVKLAIKRLTTHGAHISGIVFYQLAPEKMIRAAESGVSHLRLQPLPPSTSEGDNLLQPTSRDLAPHLPPTHKERDHERQGSQTLTFFDSQGENKRLKVHLQHAEVEHRVHWTGGPYNADFKAQVAIEALKQQRPIDELAKQYQINPALVSQWKRQIQRRAKELFETRTEPTDEENKPSQTELYAEIGRLKMEVDRLKKMPNLFAPDDYQKD